jgi:DNA-binding response OmpR family regulator
MEATAKIDRPDERDPNVGVARPGRPAPHVYEFGDVCVDTRRSAVQRDGQHVPLGATEYRLLCYFLERPGQTVSRQELLVSVWGYNPAISSRTIDVHMAGLRRKLERSPNCPLHLLTVHGLGYKFVVDR